MAGPCGQKLHPAASSQWKVGEGWLLCLPALREFWVRFTHSHAGICTHKHTFIYRCVHTQRHTHIHKQDTSTHTDVYRHRHQSAAGPDHTPQEEHVEELTHSQKRKFLGAAAEGRYRILRSVYLAPEMRAFTGVLKRGYAHTGTHSCTHKHAHRHTLLADTGSASCPAPPPKYRGPQPLHCASGNLGPLAAKGRRG